MIVFASDAMRHPFGQDATASPPPSGFTLLELVVVVFLISLMLFLAVPRFGGTFSSDSARKSTLWIIATIRNLKEAAVQDQKDYVLHVDISGNAMWVTHGGMSEDELDEARSQGKAFEAGITLLDVEFPLTDKVTIGSAEIRFSPKGFSSMAIIHAEADDGRRLSFDVQPFLSSARLFEEYIEYDSNF